MDGWMDGRVDKWTDGWLKGLMDLCTNGNMYTRKHSTNLFIINIKQLDALNFIISLFQASTCFEHMCSSSGEQNCIIQSLVSSHL